MNTGIYCLIIKLFQNFNIKIGKLGTFDFPEGYYVYVGSAQNNLERRIGRHLRQEKKAHWHIDYLLNYGKVIDVYKYPGEKRAECTISREISNIKKTLVPVKGFGSSDCSCTAHLYCFRNNPGLALVRLGKKLDPAVRRQ